MAGQTFAFLWYPRSSCISSVKTCPPMLLLCNYHALDRPSKRLALEARRRLEAGGYEYILKSSVGKYSLFIIYCGLQMFITFSLPRATLARGLSKIYRLPELERCCSRSSRSVQYVFYTAEESSFHSFICLFWY